MSAHAINVRNQTVIALTKKEKEDLARYLTLSNDIHTQFENAIHSLPPSALWKQTPDCIQALDKRRDKCNNNEEYAEILKRVYPCVDERMKDTMLRGQEYRRERNRLYHSVWEDFEQETGIRHSCSSSHDSNDENVEKTVEMEVEVEVETEIELKKEKDAKTDAKKEKEKEKAYQDTDSRLKGNRGPVSYTIDETDIVDGPHTITKEEGNSLLTKGFDTTRDKYGVFLGQVRSYYIPLFEIDEEWKKIKDRLKGSPQVVGGNRLRANILSSYERIQLNARKSDREEKIIKEYHICRTEKKTPEEGQRKKIHKPKKAPEEMERKKIHKPKRAPTDGWIE